MPAAITHQLFGESILSTLGQTGDGSAMALTRDEWTRQAFLIGNQGPDPLFFLLRDPHPVMMKMLGSTMHRHGGARFVEAFDRSIQPTIPMIRQGGASGIGRAYLCGFLCHYILDRAMHPFIYSVQYRLMDSGVAGLENAGHEIHGQIESDLDMMMLHTMRHTDISAYRPYRDALQSDVPVLDAIDRPFREGVLAAYDMSLTSRVFKRSVGDMRLSMRVLYSPSGMKRNLVGKVERLFREHSLAQAMSQTLGVTDHCDFDNRDHAPWVNPFSGDVSTSSYLDLFGSARSEALDFLRGHLDGTFSAPDIFDGRDFSGRVVDA